MSSGKTSAIAAAKRIKNATRRFNAAVKEQIEAIVAAALLTGATPADLEPMESHWRDIQGWADIEYVEAFRALMPLIAAETASLPADLEPEPGSLVQLEWIAENAAAIATRSEILVDEWTPVAKADELDAVENTRTYAKACRNLERQARTKLEELRKLEGAKK